jgi:hypothetical protein
MNVNEAKTDNYPITIFFLNKLFWPHRGKMLPPPPRALLLVSHLPARIFKTPLLPKIIFHVSSRYSAVQTTNSIPILLCSFFFFIFISLVPIDIILCYYVIKRRSVQSKFL